MKLFYFAAFLLILSTLISIDGLKILAVLPVLSKSHWIIGHEIVKSLVDAGHQATVLSPYPLKTPIPNYEEIDISKVLELLEKDMDFDPFRLAKLPAILGLPFLHSVGKKLVPMLMESENMKTFMKRREKYDVCFMETFHFNALSGIFDHFGCIYIPYSSSTITQWVDVMTSNISPSSYIPNAVLPYAGKMTFTERVWNVIYDNFESLLYNVYSLPTQRSLYNKYFPNAKKSYDQMINGVALAFISNHPSLSGARPYLPNMIEIAGIHVKPAQPLPKDIKEFLDSGTDGVVLFSMGSILRAEKFPDYVREAFVGAFSKIKNKVLWKYENETLPNKPDNVKISPWIPQRDILSHPNVKVFISHGGFLGTTEAASEGVPILGMAMFGDQGRNLAWSTSQERGLGLSIFDITEEKILNSLNELLNNPKYKKNAEEVARRFKDRVMTPQQQVVYWTEYVARHKGAPFLRSAGTELSFVELYSLDVYAVMLAIILAVLYIEFKILAFIVSKFRGKAAVKTTTKKQKTK